MKKASVLLVSIVIISCLGFAALSSAQGLPDAFNRALQDISAIEGRPVTTAQLLNYTYREVLDDFFAGCGSNPPLMIRYYVVNVTTDQQNWYIYHVASDGTRIKQCSYGHVEPTATPTIDLMRTTATPSRTPTSTSTATNTFTPLPTFTPSNTPTATETPRPGAMRCEGFLYSRLMIGEQGRVLPGGMPNRLREQPSADAAQVGVIPPEQVFTVLAGPQCDPAGRAWWQVRYLKTEGWTVEGEGQIYYVEPILPPTPVLFPTNTPSSSG